jgi:hypothetical protein
MTYTITQLTTGNSLLAVRNDYQISSNNSALWVENGALKFYNGQNTRILESSGFFDPQASNGKAVWYKIKSLYQDFLFLRLALMLFCLMVTLLLT